MERGSSADCRHSSRWRRAPGDVLAVGINSATISSTMALSSARLGLVRIGTGGNSASRRAST